MAFAAQATPRLSHDHERPPVRLGVIGCGNVLAAYIPAIDRLRLAGAATVALACGREHQREQASAQLRTPHFTTEPQDVIQSGEVDAVLILTSMKEHAPLARAALEAGKHVVLEKPMATTRADAARLLQTARRTERHLVCAPFTTLSPTFQTMAARIRRGDIGRPCSARARYGWSGPWWSDWFYKQGGGCLFDLGVYCVTSLTGLLGPVLRVMAMTGVAIPQRRIGDQTITVEAEDNAQVLLDFGDSVFAAVTTGFTLQQYRSPALEVYGTEGTLQMLGDDWDPDGYELWENRVGAWQVFKETQPDWSWTDGLPHLVECLQEQRAPLVTPEHAFHVLDVMLRAQASGSAGRAMEVDSTFTPATATSTVTPLPDTAEAHRIHDRSRRH